MSIRIKDILGLCIFLVMVLIIPLSDPNEVCAAYTYSQGSYVGNYTPPPGVELPRLCTNGNVIDPYKNIDFVTELPDPYSQSAYGNGYSESSYGGGYSESSYSTQSGYSNNQCDDFSGSCTTQSGNNPPKVWLSVDNRADNAGYQSSNMRIAPGDKIWLKWQATANATKCTGTNFGTGGDINGTQKNVTEPGPGKSILYTVTCTGKGGTAVDSLRVITYPYPTVTLTADNRSDGAGYQSGSLSITSGDQVWLRWASTDATKCTGSKFSTGGSVASTQQNVTEPAAGGSTVYTVSCTGPGGSAAASLTVSSSARSCTLNGVTMPSGTSRTFYSSNSVPSGNSCSTVSQTRTCTDGVLSGNNSYQYSTCTTAPALSCTLDGVTIPSGTSRTFYSSNSVSFGNSCSTVAQSRTCTNGVFSGNSSYRYNSCTPSTAQSCTLNGVTIPSGGSHVFYNDTVSPLGNSCDSITQIRSCTNGLLSGDSSYRFNNCTQNANAVLGDISITANPKVIRSGEDTLITWDGSNANACTVTGPASFNATGVTGSKQAQDITGKSTFTLRCTLGSQSKSASTTVEVLPSIEET